MTAAFVTPIIAVSAGADFGASGWGIFRKVQSAQFSGIAAAAPSNGDVSGILYNPAVLGMTRSRRLSFISEQGMDSDRFGCVIFTEPARARSMIAAGITYYDAGQAELNWLDNGVLKSNTVSAQKDMMGFVVFEHRPWRRLSLGISLKAASSELAEQYKAYACVADAGIMYLPVNNLSFSLAAQNMGTATKFIEKTNPLPTGLYGGCGYIFFSRHTYVLPTVGVTFLVNDEKSVPEAGLEIGCGFISVNGGYRCFKGESTMHVGMEIVWDAYTFGYAFLPGTHLDTVHRLSVGYRFKTPVKRSARAMRMNL